MTSALPDDATFQAVYDYAKYLADVVNDRQWELENLPISNLALYYKSLWNLCSVMDAWALDPAFHPTREVDESSWKIVLGKLENLREDAKKHLEKNNLLTV